MNEQSFNVQSAPNKSKIRGKIIKIEKDSKLMTTIWQVEVDKSFDVEGMLNFTKLRIGNTIKIYMPLEKEEEKFEEGDLIGALVSFQGDETGGVFFVEDKSIQLIKSSKH